MDINPTLDTLRRNLLLHWIPEDGDQQIQVCADQMKALQRELNKRSLGIDYAVFPYTHNRKMITLYATRDGLRLHHLTLSYLVTFNFETSVARFGNYCDELRKIIAQHDSTEFKRERLS